MTANKPSHFPHIHLLCMEEKFITAFRAARLSQRLPSSVSITIHHCSLEELPSSVQFDTIVSPANSYGRLDGAFDDAISYAFSPRDDYDALTKAAQTVLFHKHRGFAPPGTCTLVRIPDEFHARSRNVWGTRRVALCPTMRMPSDVRWDREVVYECIWSLLCAIDNHNRDVQDGIAAEGDDPIRSLLMTPIATGVGRVSPEKWATQTVLALKHFDQANENPEQWSSLGWPDLGRSCFEVKRTWEE
ncbi:hypothetical protein B0J13DRAFT_561488 [Dactylonectria estremocensis]|uniref:Macro domain-like protein n=1 Tax=Dactylonectria estremocensis TaxID=1079267 RepID=A0A9P9E7Z7_9HYPO|nr:hypothetical protein B0J13DRAFT_561488 [Dactylonectria estremocensis]